MGTTPFFVGTDTNIDPDTSDAIKLATDNGILRDNPKDWLPERKTPANILLEGVYKGMTGSGTSHIDTVSTNLPGGHACQFFEYHWQQSAGHDHVALLFIINALRFDEEVETLTKPQSLGLPAKTTGIAKGLLEARLNQL